tara:strand:- start:1500 stop:2990 length:1491 start_codon:yes stop_codon:yes gene_type:complete
MNEKIIKIIKDWRNADTGLKRELIKEVVKTGSSDGLKLLSQIVNRDRDIEIRQSARKAYNSLYNYCYPSLDDSIVEQNITESLDEQELVEMLSSNDPEMEMRALIYLQIKPTEDAFSYLRSNFDRYSDDHVKATLVKTIGMHGTAQDVPACYRFLEDESPRVRANAIEALEIINHPNTYMIFVQWLSDSDNRVKANCIKALRKLGQQSVNRILEEMLCSEYMAYKESALYVISLSPSRQGLNLIQTFLSEEYDPALIERALHVIHEFSNANVPGAAEYLDDYYKDCEYQEASEVFHSDFKLQDLNSADPDVVLRCLSRILENQYLNHGESMDALLKSDSSDARVISFVIRIFGELKMVEFLPSVLTYIDSEDNRIRANAVEASGRLGYQGKELSKYLEDPNNRVRANAIVALAGLVDVAEAINMMSQHQDPLFRQSLLYAIKQIRDECALDALEYLIHDNEISIRNQALEVLQFYEICGIEGATQVLQQYGQSLYG